MGKHDKILSYFPYSFTFDQAKAISDICKDLSSGRVMQRLVHGEVGSGKTSAAFYAAMLAALNGRRTLILCPTTILAQQHYDTLRGMGWEDCQLWLGMGKSQGSIGPSITVGTHALLYNDTLPRAVSLVIIDEFQKFGVRQRAILQQYGNPHLLLMSATPIPRTLAMTVFGDLDVSTIKELPIKRGQVITRSILPEKREGMYEIIEGELAKGKQVYVVYPRISSGDEDVVSAERGFQEIQKRFARTNICPWSSLSLLTGRATAEGKARALREFRSGQTQILVSTIITEVGLDCPNASVMVIEGADRFGLSQLHQLRGRVCRSTDTTYCFMVSETANPTSIARLDIMTKCNGGFEIAEQDLRLRGPGELFSTRQHGLPDLKFASLLDDYDLLLKARDLANEYINRLDEPGNAGLKEMLHHKYGDTLSLGETV